MLIVEMRELQVSKGKDMYRANPDRLLSRDCDRGYVCRGSQERVSSRHAHVHQNCQGMTKLDGRHIWGHWAESEVERSQHGTDGTCSLARLAST